MTKKKRDLSPEVNKAAEPRRHRGLRQKEAQIRRRVVLVTSITMGLVVLLILTGVLNQYALKPRRAIAKVNQDKITITEFQRRLRFEQDNLVNQIQQYIQFGKQFADQTGSNPFQSIISQLSSNLSTPDSYSLTVLDKMIEGKMIQQLAEKYKVVVSPEDVQLSLEKQFGYDRSATPTPTPEAGTVVTDTNPAANALTADEFQQRYNQFIADLGSRNSLTEDEFRQQIALNLLRERLQEAAPLEFDSTAEMVKVRAILAKVNPDPLDPVRAEADALAKAFAARKRIVDGEDFAVVAKELSEDPGSAPNGGELGWFGRGQMVPAFEDAAFSLAVNEISQPVKTDFGFHIIQVEEKDEAKDQVRARHILFRIDTSPAADAVAAAEKKALSKLDDAKTRIEAGESFADVAKELSDDPVSAEKGGDLGWFAADNTRLPAEVVTAAFSLEPGQLSDPIKTNAGYYLIQVEEKDPQHPVDENELKSRRQQAFDDWLKAQTEAADIQRNWSLDLVPPLPNDLQSIVNNLQQPAG
ncbi:MAG: hypothetical protein GXP37_06960 [Chloroflexi bacterium]|nr:hypothetical protein [Chloroflexota bacterium]